MSKKHLTEQQKLFVVKQQEKKLINDDCISKKQLECWSRWVDAKVIYRKLKDNPPDWFNWLEKQLDGTHYILTEKMFNLIKTKYDNLQM